MNNNKAIEQYIQTLTKDIPDENRLINTARANTILSIKKIEIEVEQIKRCITESSKTPNLNKLLVVGASMEILLCDLEKIRLKYL